MGCDQSKAKIDEFQAREESMMGSASKCVVNDKELEHAQKLVKQVRMAIEIQLGSFWPEKNMSATQMITRQFISDLNQSVHNGSDPSAGTMFYVKVHTTNKEWPWIHVKVYEPPVISGGGLVNFRGMKKFKQDCDLKTFWAFLLLTKCTQQLLYYYATSSSFTTLYITFCLELGGVGLRSYLLQRIYSTYICNCINQSILIIGSNDDHQHINNVRRVIWIHFQSSQQWIYCIVQLI